MRWFFAGRTRDSMEIPIPFCSPRSTALYREVSHRLRGRPDERAIEKSNGNGKKSNSWIFETTNIRQLMEKNVYAFKQKETETKNWEPRCACARAKNLPTHNYNVNEFQLQAACNYSLYWRLCRSVRWIGRYLRTLFGTISPKKQKKTTTTMKKKTVEENKSIENNNNNNKK